MCDPEGRLPKGGRPFFIPGYLALRTAPITRFRAFAQRPLIVLVAEWFDWLILEDTRPYFPLPPPAFMRAMVVAFLFGILTRKKDSPSTPEATHGLRKGRGVRRSQSRERVPEEDYQAWQKNFAC